MVEKVSKMYSFRKRLKLLYFSLIKIADSRRLLEKIRADGALVILNLHKVSPQKNPYYPALNPKHFETLLQFVTRHFDIVTFGDLQGYVRTSEKTPLILSFDDGFHDFLDYAAPLLDRYGVRANLNIIPECVESGLPVWDVLLGDFLLSVDPVLLNELNMPGFSMKPNRNSPTAYALALTSYLKKYPRKRRREYWKEIKRLMERTEMTPTPMLNRNEVKSLATVHEIGVHSFSHESMGLENEEFFRKDFQRCVDYFQNVLHLPMEIYAFPNGSYREEQIDFLLREGVEHVLLVNETFSSPSVRVHQRFTFYGDSTAEIELRSLGWQRNIEI